MEPVTTPRERLQAKYDALAHRRGLAYANQERWQKKHGFLSEECSKIYKVLQLSDEQLDALVGEAQ